MVRLSYRTDATPSSASSHARIAYRLELFWARISPPELPLRSVGPEPATMSATGIFPLTSLGRVSVPGSDSVSLANSYGDSITVDGAVVSIGARAMVSANARVSVAAAAVAHTQTAKT